MNRNKLLQLLTLTVFLLTTSYKPLAGQTNNIKLQIDSLKYLDKDAFECSSVYWKIIATGKDAIPFLIANLEDTTPTKIKYVCKKEQLKFGDICFVALEQIFNIPLFYVTGQQFDYYENGCRGGVLTYLDNNRKKIKDPITDYYKTYQSEIKFLKYAGGYKDECKMANNIYGYYDIDVKLLKDK